MSPTRLLYSHTYRGQRQKCTGLDQLLLAQGPWEDEPILIRGIALTHRVYPTTNDAFAMAGSSAVDGDILGHVSGSGTAHVMYPSDCGFLFPGRPSDRHLDVHSWCRVGHYHEAWLTIFYEKPVPDTFDPKPVPQVNDDRLKEIARLHPLYQPVLYDLPDLQWPLSSVPIPVRLAWRKLRSVLNLRRGAD